VNQEPAVAREDVLTRRQARQILREIRDIAAIMKAAGLKLDARQWVFLLAITLISAPPGLVLGKKGYF
jgi:hypothetical protein